MCLTTVCCLPQLSALKKKKKKSLAWTKFDRWYDCEMLSSTNWHLCEWIIGLKGVLYPNLFLCDTALFMTRFVTFSQNKSTSSSRDSVLYLFIPWQNNIQFAPLNLVLTRWMMAHLFLVWDVALGSWFNYANVYFPNTETMVSWATSSTLYTRRWHQCKCISCMQHVAEHVIDWNYRRGVRQVIWHYQIFIVALETVVQLWLVLLLDRR